MNKRTISLCDKFDYATGTITIGRTEYTFTGCSRCVDDGSIREAVKNRLGYTLLYARDIDSWLRFTYPFNIDYARAALRSVLPAFDSGYFGHKWWLLRDVLRVMPKRARCLECGRIESRWHETWTGDKSEMTDWVGVYHPALPTCSLLCWDKRQKRLRRKELKRRREKKCLKEARRTLRSVRAYLNNPNNNQKACL